MKKNYGILLLLIIVTVFATLYLASIYKTKDEVTSEFYNTSNKITFDELNEYIIENPDAIIYISNKSDLTNNDFEMKFKSKIQTLNLTEKLVYIDKNTISKKALSEFEKKSDVKININKTPFVLIVVDKKIIKCIYINDNTDINNFIDYEVFE